MSRKCPFRFPDGPEGPEVGSRLAAFRRGLRDLGYVEGQNIIIEQRHTEQRAQKLPELAAELVRLKVDVVVIHGTHAMLAVQKADRALPIVMAVHADPVAAAASNRPWEPGFLTCALAAVAAAKGQPAVAEAVLELTPDVTREFLEWISER